MPASHPALTIAQNQANGAATPNPSAFVIYDPISGPKGSPLDVRVITGYGADKAPTYANAAATQNPSTGAMSTGIGLGENDIIGLSAGMLTPQEAIFKHGFNDNDQPGTVPTYSAPPPNGVVASSTIDSTRLYIGGGRSPAQDPVTHVGVPNPYTTGIVICGSGNGGSRDATAGPAFQGFGMKMVTAVGAVAVGSVVETGWVNRANRSIVVNESIFGSAVAASGAIS